MVKTEAAPYAAALFLVVAVVIVFSTTCEATDTSTSTEDRFLRSLSFEYSPEQASNERSCKPMQYEDERCREFCDEFVRLCENPSFTTGYANGGGLEGCLNACAQYPRTGYDHRDPVADHGGDTLQCREFHLFLISLGPPHSGAYHCPHVSPEGGYTCGNFGIDGVSPFQIERRGACSLRRFGYCDLSAKDTVADCESSAEITDETLPRALASLPETVEILLLTKVEGITALPANVFAENMKNPSGLRALYVNGCKVNRLDVDSFSGLANLEILNLDANEIASLPSGVLFHTPKLTEFYMFQNELSDGNVWGEDANLFSRTPDLRSINISNMKGITSIAEGALAGLGQLELLKMANCALSNAGIPNGVFDDLVSLNTLDLVLNELTSVDPDWFSGGWARNLQVLALLQNQISGPIDESTFASLVDLRRIYLNDNPIPPFDADAVFANNPRLTTLTI